MSINHSQQAKYLATHGNPKEAPVYGLHTGFLVAAAICAVGVVIAASRRDRGNG